MRRAGNAGRFTKEEKEEARRLLRELYDKSDYVNRVEVPDDDYDGLQMKTVRLTPKQMEIRRLAQQKKQEEPE